MSNITTSNITNNSIKDTELNTYKNNSILLAEFVMKYIDRGDPRSKINMISLAEEILKRK